MAENFDVYMVTDKGLQAGQVVINRYFYQRNSVVANVFASDVADQYIALVLPSVLAIQSAEVVHTEIEVKNLFDPSDSATVAISEPGTYAAASAETLPVFTAVSFTLTSGNGAVRNGAKRYPGVVESTQNDGVIEAVLYIDVLDDLATQLSDALPIGVVDTLFPIIVSSILTGGEYVLPTSLAELVFGSVVDSVFHALLTSQTSRKIGVGE